MKAAARKTPKAAPAKPATKRRAAVMEFRPGIERDTELMPWLIADSVVAEAGRWLGVDLPEEWSAWLDKRAEGCYKKSARFHKLLHRRGNGGRDTLYVFMRHWLAARMMKETPALARRMPRDFANGIACPPRSPSTNTPGIAPCRFD